MTDQPAQPEPRPLIDERPESYHIEAAHSLVDRPLRTLKRDDLFGVFDKQGDVNFPDAGPEGVYFHDTRFLSRLALRVGGRPPLLLGSVVLDDNGALVVDMSNADLREAEGQIGLQRDSVAINRVKLLGSDTCYERIMLRRFGAVGVLLPVQLAFDADFADLFEVRGDTRARRGTTAVAILDKRSLRFTYEGLDAVTRTTTFYFDPPPARLSIKSAEWDVDLVAAERCAVIVKVHCAIDAAEAAEPPSHLAAFRAQRRASRSRRHGLAGVTTSNEIANEVIDRAVADIDMLLTQTDYGLYPYAGTPWYSTIFGRDGILTAMQLLWIAPEIARGVLQALALTQATASDREADARPGKILHEMRGGEMANLKEVPFGRYYGSNDATPLFVWLAGDYWRRTGDTATIEGIWPNILAALHWLDRFGDSDGDGFVEYQRQTERGLANQGWKDSHDSVFHADGRLAEGPIALCEVQAYAFAAKRAGAELARALGDDGRAHALDAEAETLRRRFEEAFWLEDLGTYALALDGAKQPCRVRASNAGHALFAGIAAPDRATRVAEQLTSRAFFSGWGVRTIALGEARYNPMAYHNGSVWPHDNAVIAMGLARYGHKAAAARIFDGLLDAARYFEFRRLPELFCGFTRRGKRGPTAYPVACAPQAWAAAAPFALIKAVVGLELDHQSDHVVLRDPTLPDAIDALSLPNVRINGSRLDLRLSRRGGDVLTAVTGREGTAGLVIVK